MNGIRRARWARVGRIALCGTLVLGCFGHRETWEESTRRLQTYRDDLLSDDSTYKEKEYAFEGLTLVFDRSRGPRQFNESILEFLLDVSVRYAGTDADRMIEVLSWRLGKRKRLSPGEWRVVMRREPNLVDAFRRTGSPGLAELLACIRSELALPAFEEVLGRQDLDREAKFRITCDLSSYECPEAERILGQVANREKGRPRAYALYVLVRSGRKEYASGLLEELKATDSADSRYKLVCAVKKAWRRRKGGEEWQENLRQAALRIVEKRKRKGEIDVKEFSNLSEILSGR